MKIEKQNNIADKLLKLYSHNEIENSKFHITIIQKKIDTCKLELDDLNNDKPYWFQKKKLNAHEKKIQELNKKIYQYNLEIEEQLKFIDELKNY